MAASDNGFTSQQLTIIERLREVLSAAKAKGIHIAGVNDFEAHTLMDAEGKPYISFT
jgi:hypothetical protein